MAAKVTRILNTNDFKLVARLLRLNLVATLSQDQKNFDRGKYLQIFLVNELINAIYSPRLTTRRSK